jgi:hypothetical protein
MAGHGPSGKASDDELDPDEPRTPLWLPLLGLCLFVAALAYVLSRESEAPATEAPVGSAEPEPAASAPAQAPH